MSTIFDLLYHEYCRARLAEMRKQLLIPIASDESRKRTGIAAILPPPGDWGSVSGAGAATKEAPTIK